MFPETLLQTPAATEHLKDGSTFLSPDSAVNRRWLLSCVSAQAEKVS